MRGPEPLSSGHRIEDFRCGVAALDEWLRRRALANQVSGASRTWVAADDDDAVVAYYASATTAVARASVSAGMARNQPDPIPAILLARLAVDERHAGRGLGAALLKHFIVSAAAVADLVGVRLLMVQASTPTARAFYEHFGFAPSRIDDLILVRLL